MNRREPEDAVSDLVGAFDYQEGDTVASTPKLNSYLTSAALWLSALGMGAYFTLVFLPIIWEGGTVGMIFLAVFAILMGFHGSVSLAAIVWMQKMMRYIEVNFAKRSITLPSNNIVPFGIPRRDIPFNDVADVRVVTQTFSTGKQLHKFELMPYHSDVPLATLTARRDPGYDVDKTLQALKDVVLTMDTPSDAVFHSALTRVPEFRFDPAKDHDKVPK